MIQLALYLTTFASLIIGAIMMFVFFNFLFTERPLLGLLWAGGIGTTFLGAMAVAEWLLF